MASNTKKETKITDYSNLTKELPGMSPAQRAVTIDYHLKRVQMEEDAVRNLISDFTYQMTERKDPLWLDNYSDLTENLVEAYIVFPTKATFSGDEYIFTEGYPLTALGKAVWVRELGCTITLRIKRVEEIDPGIVRTGADFGTLKLYLGALHYCGEVTRSCYKTTIEIVVTQDQ